MSMHNAGDYLPAPVTHSLPDGTAVTIRPIRPDDAPRLQALFDRLSPQSAYLRFLAPMRHLSASQAEYLANVDYQARMALVATRDEEGQEQIIAVARYGVIETGAPGRAEFAIAVEDAFQGQGLGTRLMHELAAYARLHGIHTVVGTVAYENTRMLRFIRRLGLPSQMSAMARGELDISIDLAAGGESTPTCAAPP